MTTPPTVVRLTEWQTRRPEPGSGLDGRALGGEADRALAARLSRARVLEVSELRAGLSVRSFSFVGKLRLGDLEIEVRPKLFKPSTLLNLLRYAYGFRKLQVFAQAPQILDQSGFADLLVYELTAIVRDLLARGPRRDYVPRHEWLASPKGRIDIGRLAARGDMAGPALPCTHHQRIEDSLLNRLLVAGLRLAGVVAADLALRREARRLAARLEDRVTTIRLNAAALAQGFARLNRMTRAYEPALVLIRLLREGQGVILSDSVRAYRLPGFLFDMNRFFQALLSRFLHENLPEHSVRDEHRLGGMMRFVPGFNPRNSHAPAPRPDLVVFRGNSPIAILDAKYRDLWEKNLPREMLYQLAVYASGHETRTATILYPAQDERAAEARISVLDPVGGGQIGQVRLRPVQLSTLEDHVTAGDSPAELRLRKSYAEWLLNGQ